jgi:hypothetical protein
MADADIFVTLKNCQFEKNGFQNRFNMNGKWYTMSTKRGLDPICEKKYLSPQKDWENIKRGLPEYENILSLFDVDIHENLSIANERIIKRIASLLEIQTQVVTDFPTDKKSTSRLIEICKKNGATKYLSGPSGKTYLAEEEFLDCGIEVIYFGENTVKKPILEVLKERIRP